MKHIKKLLPYCLMTSLLLTGCASEEAGTTNSTTGDVSTSSNDAIVVYMNDFDQIIGDMFREATGYEMEVVTGNGAETMSRIAAEGSNPQWDVVWIDSMPSVHSLAEAGDLLLDFEPENASLLTEFAGEVVPDNKAYYPTGAHAAAVLAYNHEVFDESTAPETFDDLIDPNHGFEVAMADPSVAAPAYPLAAWFMEDKGMEAGKEYFSALFANGLKVYPKNPQIVQALSGGEVNVALLQESNAYEMIANGEPITIIWPEGGAPASMRVAGISAQSDNMEVAQAFINFLLDPEVQQELVNTGDEGYFEPSVVGAEMNEDRQRDGATLDYADAAWAAENEAEIKAWFADMSF